MSVERGDSMLRVCQQHLLSQVDTAATQSGRKKGGNRLVRERERAKERKREGKGLKGMKGQYARQEK